MSVHLIDALHFYLNAILPMCIFTYICFTTYNTNNLNFMQSFHSCMNTNPGVSLTQIPTKKPSELTELPAEAALTVL